MPSMPVVGPIKNILPLCNNPKLPERPVLDQTKNPGNPLSGRCAKSRQGQNYPDHGFPEGLLTSLKTLTPQEIPTAFLLWPNQKRLSPIKDYLLVHKPVLHKQQKADRLILGEW